MTSHRNPETAIGILKDVGNLSMIALQFRMRFSAFRLWGSHDSYTAISLAILNRSFFSTRAEEYAKYGLPQNFLVIRKTYFTLGLKDFRSIAWAYEYLTPDMTEGNAKRRKMKYRVDKELPPIARTSTKDYRRTGYVRGHLAAAGNYKFSEKAVRETFLLSNILPQNGDLNSNYWLTLEKTVRLWLNVFPKLHIMTGPLYLSESSNHLQRIGPKNIPVPTHLFKVVLGESENGSVAMKAFVVPNRSIPRETPLNRFATTVEKVERVAGFAVFHKLDSEKTTFLQLPTI